MLKALLLLLFFSQPVQAKEQAKLAGDGLTTKGMWSAGLGPPVTLVGAYALVAGAFSGETAFVIPGVIVGFAGASGTLAGSPMMLYGNQKMIGDLESKGGRVDQTALKWSYGFTLTSVASGALFLWPPEFLYMNDSLGAANFGIGFISYVGSIVSSGVQQKRTRKAFQGLSNKQVSKPSRSRLVIRPMIGHQRVGLMGQF